MFAAKARTTKSTESSPQYNSYLADILPLFSKEQPDPSDVFKKLMEHHIKLANHTRLGVRVHRYFSHTDDAKFVLDLFDKHDKKQVMREIFAFLKNISTLNPNGHFCQALSTFFAIYPEYINQCSEKMREAVTAYNIWQSSITSWLSKFTQIVRGGANSHQHEFLQALSANIPEDAIDSYADFLLGQIHHKDSNETYKGLYIGWVYASLGALAPRLSIIKRDLVSKALHAAFAKRDKTNPDLSLIGLCEALCNLNPPIATQKEIADDLYLYVIKNLGLLQSLQEKHRPPTVSLYIQKAFRVLKQLENQLTTEIRMSLIGAMLQSEDSLYKLRLSILELESWVPNEKKLEVMNKLNPHPQFLTLATLFWNWLALDKNHSNNNHWALRNQYTSHFTNAIHDLRGVIVHDSPIAEQARLLVLNGPSTDKDTRADIIENLNAELLEHNQGCSASTVRQSLHKALVELKSWMSEEDCELTASSLLDSCTNTNDPFDVRISAGLAASSFHEYLLPAEQMKLQNSLLSLLGTTHGTDAADALRAHAIKLNRAELPALMTCLMTKPKNSYAQLLLTDLHALYEKTQPALEQKSLLKM